MTEQEAEAVAVKLWRHEHDSALRAHLRTLRSVRAMTNVELAEDGISRHRLGRTIRTVCQELRRRGLKP